MSIFATSGTASAQQPQLVLKWRVNDTDPVFIYVPGELDDDGTFHFQGKLEDPAGNWHLSWNFNADLNPADQLLISGPITVHNLSSETTSYKLTATFPVCPASPGVGLMGGVVVVGMTSNPGGGSLTCPEGDSVWTLRFDSETVQQLFYGPYDMTAGGASNFAVSGNFGIPIPSAPAPPILSAAVIRYRFALTDGDIGAINSSVTIVDDPAQPGQPIDPDCPSDLNGDGVTDAVDLSTLFGDWGASGSCLQGDIDGDGEVSSSDLVLLLGLWGFCA